MSGRIFDEYENRPVPEDKRYTALDLPGMYIRCRVCMDATVNFTIYPEKPADICDICYKRQCDANSK